MNNKRENQYRQLGLMIAYYRKLKGLTQMQLAELVGVSRTHISNLEAPNMDKSHFSGSAVRYFRRAECSH